ncbi:MAG: hypothetical protein GWP04_10600 [Gammaproteobacteria bacterium]|nr:hypothetical protein [Gammaproteobacteria bacterium]
MTQYKNQGPWYQRISESGLPDLLPEVLSQLDSKDAADPAEQDHVDRQRRIAETIGWVIENTDPMLIAGTTITQLANHVRQGREHLSQWVTSGVSEQLVTHAATQFDAALAVLGAIPITTEMAESSAEITSLRRSVGQHRAQVDREIEDLRTASTTAQEQFTAQAQKATTRVADLESEITRLEEELKQIVALARDQGNQQQNAFASAQTERQEAFSRMLEEKREEATAEVEAVRKESVQQLSETKTTVTNELAEVEAVKSRIETILGIVGEEALVGTYSKNADKDQREADRWRWLALAAVVAVVAIGIWMVIAAVRPGTEWDLFAAKALLALPVAGAAAYAAKQSSEHRYAQREAEHIALQLAALKPYLNDLEQATDRDRLLGEIAHRLFGQPRRYPGENATPEFGDGPGTLNQVMALLQQLAKIKA